MPHLGRLRTVLGALAANEESAAHMARVFGACVSRVSNQRGQEPSCGREHASGQYLAAA